MGSGLCFSIFSRGRRVFSALWRKSKNTDLTPLLFLVASSAFAGGPDVVVVTGPKGLVQPSGGAASTDSFTIANIGTSDANVNFARTGNFFSISPSGIVLAPGASQTITIRGTSQPGGVFDGSVTITGSGVPQNGITLRVRMMTGPVPSGTVDPQAQVGLVNIAGPPDQIHVSGVSFRNNGNVTMQGITVG